MDPFLQAAIDEVRPRPIILVNCTGCGRCVAACRFQALSLTTEKENGIGSKRAELDGARCTGCKECLPACPHAALSWPAK